MEQCGGDWDNYLNAVYDHFCADFIFHKTYYNGVRVAVRKIPESKGKGYGFWHCISEGAKEEEERIPDLERCKRIKWIKAIIEHADNPEIDTWSNRRGRERCRLLWYQEQFLVVLAERKRKEDGKKYYLLKTAYCTTRPNQVKRLRKERDAFKMADAAPEDGV
ncbi:MAG: hypothetical protein GY869_16740 [Planctomycetes bacterium]|nr:hypothetical protein [Planctomycetota bacterium]